MSERKFTVILNKESVGGYSVRVVELPGCISQGETKEEALRSIREAIECYLEAREKLSRKNPQNGTLAKRKN